MPCFPQAAEPIGRVGRKCSERRCPMATQPEIPPPDRIDPQSPPETPPDSPPSEDPFRQPPEIVPDQPDYDKPDRAPIDTPPQLGSAHACTPVTNAHPPRRPLP